RPDRQEAVDALVVGQAAPHAEEVRVEGAAPLVGAVQVAPGGVALPDLDQRVRDGAAVLVEHATGHDDALAERLSTRSGVRRQVGVLGRDRADAGARAGQLPDPQRDLDQRLARRTLHRRLVRLVEVGREDLLVALDQRADGCRQRHAPAPISPPFGEDHPNGGWGRGPRRRKGRRAVGTPPHRPQTTPTYPSPGGGEPSSLFATAKALTAAGTPA